VKVESYSGYRYGQRPIAVWWQGKRWNVIEVVREWRSTEVTPGTSPEPGRGIEDHFRVRIAPSETEPEQLVELLYTRVDDAWWLRVIG
jgi:hypothetical protein